MKKKKWKDIRSAVTMMCVMLAMISTATYAWFTMSESATVTGLQMTAVTSGGLLVSTDRANWSSAVDLRGENEESAVLTPVSVVTSALMDVTIDNVTFKSPQFQMPKYDGAYSVTDLYAASGNTGDDEVYNLTEATFGDRAIKKTFYIKEGEGAAVNVGIQIVDAGEIATALKQANAAEVGLVNGQPNYDGSFVVLDTGSLTNADAAADDALEAVRVGLVIYKGANDTNPELVIWEPNCDLTALSTATFATNSVPTSKAALAPAVRSNYDGQINSTNPGTIGGTGYKSGTLFTFDAGDTDGVRVDVFMWFEGQDDSCVNEIMADSIIAQLKFVSLN